MICLFLLMYKMYLLLMFEQTLMISVIGNLFYRDMQEQKCAGFISVIEVFIAVCAFTVFTCRGKVFLPLISSIFCLLLMHSQEK